WGYEGLAETLRTLEAAGLKRAGAGRDALDARAPAIIHAGADNRILVFGYSVESSGVPLEWAADVARPGVRLLPDLGDAALNEVRSDVMAWRRPGDVVVASIHWGGNWGYTIPHAHRRFAHRLIDEASVDVIHGHSSHHPVGVEVHRDRPILYGCGDFLNDYEGIGGYAEFRGELSLMFLATIDRESRSLLRLRMVPLRIRRFRLERASAKDTDHLFDVLAREGQVLGTGVERDADGLLRLTWGEAVV
ncbi:MAG: CapA family protein, partial [Polyangiaceae bacterium]|nr:CapA family protein [Polyangiaceae bacterium]